MTAFNYYLNEKSLVLSMDTLCLQYPDMEPYKFATKMFLLPHIQCVICGTGNYRAAINWYCHIQNMLFADDINQLNDLAQENLNPFMDNQRDVGSTTIYQFGFNKTDNSFHGYAYRSTEDFRSEELQYGFRIKPGDAFPIVNNQVDISGCLCDGFSETFCRIMMEQKEYDDKQPVKNRIGIGGICQVLHMSESNLIIQNYHRFDDYDICYKQMQRYW